VGYRVGGGIRITHKRPKSKHLEQMFTLLGFRLENQIFVIVISTMFMYQNRSIILLLICSEGGSKYIYPHLGVQVYMSPNEPLLPEMQARKFFLTRTSSLAWGGGEGGLTDHASGY
jgi:hypothetical protein